VSGPSLASERASPERPITPSKMASLSSKEDARGTLRIPPWNFLELFLNSFELIFELYLILVV